MRLPQIMTPRGRFLPLITRPGLRGGGQQGVILPPDALPAAASGGIKKITSADASVTVTDPTGPTTDLALPDDVVRLNKDNEGGFLEVVAHSPAPNGYGVTIASDGLTSGGVFVNGGTRLDLAGDALNLAAGVLYFNKGAAGNYTIEWESGGIATGNSIFIGGHGGLTLLQIDADGSLTVALARTAAKLKVKDHSGNSVFEVRDDGTVHIKTGGTILADL